MSAPPAGGYYEAVLPGLRPNVAHQVIAWAVNANAIDGVTAAAVAFTSATYTAAPAAPTSLAAQQIAADMIELRWTPPAGGALIDYYIPYLSYNGGSYVAQKAVSAERALINVTLFGFSHALKLKAVDRFGNQSADSSSVSVTPAPYLADGYINPLGVSTPSLASEAAARAKIKLAQTSTTISVNAGATGTWPLSAYAVGVYFTSANYTDFRLGPGAGGGFAQWTAYNQHATATRDITQTYYELAA